MRTTVLCALSLMGMMAIPGMAAANVHEVIVTGFGFFPKVTYVQTGDTVEFHNESGSAQWIRASDGSWEVLVNPGSKIVQEISPNFSSSQSEYSSVNSSMDTGILTLEPPPAEAEAN